MSVWAYVGIGFGSLLVIVAIHDIVQKRHAVIRNFPIIGHFRYWLEAVGPELRQYIVTGNDEERPFSRDQRRWVYASSKKENNYFGFGTDNDLDRAHLRRRDRIAEALDREPATLVAAAEVAGTDLPDQLAAVAVVVGDAALAGILQRAGEQHAAVDRLDRRRR